MKGFIFRKSNSRFKNYGLVISTFLIISIGLNSCCTKKYCPGAEDMGAIEFMNFSSDEIDSVFLVFYAKNSDFKTVVDSLLLEVHPISETAKHLGYSPKNISIEYDYRLYFISIDEEYKISGFRTSRSECNDCLLSKDYYTRMDAYQINGYIKNSGVLQIDKLTD